MGRFDDAVKALRNVVRLLGPTADRESDLGEALTLAANGIVTAHAKATFESALARDPKAVKARFFMGVSAEQDGNKAQAAAIWREMITGSPNAAWADFVRQALARVEAAGAGAPGPSSEDVAAAADLSQDQRNTMIRGMVDRLAERLQREAGDVDGWLRLVRAYMVLGEPDKARSAVTDARRALSSDNEKLRRLDELVKGLGLEG
jgi:cytochrome c-type biogenesis protein CcmH